MNSVFAWVAIGISLIVNVFLVVIFIRHTKKVQKKYEEVKEKFTQYLADLDRKNERLDRENKKLKSKIKPQL